MVSNWFHLLDAITTEDGDWKVIFSNVFDPREIEGDIVVAIAPQEQMHSVPRPLDDVLAPLAELPPQKRLLTLHTDLHKSHGEQFRAVLDRSDLIMTTNWAPFLRRWPEYATKLFHFPFFLLPYGRYENLEFQESPITKCLVTGFASHDYPLRRHLYLQSQQDPDVAGLLAKLDHPGYEVENPPRTQVATRIGEAWARELNRYLCVLSDCSRYGYAVAKYMEIPATGALLVANEADDMARLGFVDGHNYIMVDETNVANRLHEVLAQPKAYSEIRKAGRHHALKAFGRQATLKRFREAVDRAW